MNNKDRRINSLILSMAGVIVFLTVLSIFLAITHEVQDPYDPFEYAPLWTIIKTDPELSTQSPTVPVGGKVIFAGERCNFEDESVSSYVSIWWDRVDRIDTGRVSVTEDLSVAVEAGCETITFELPVPSEISTRMIENGEERSRWKVVGTSTPKAAGGVTETWETEPVYIITGEIISPHNIGDESG